MFKSKKRRLRRKYEPEAVKFVLVPCPEGPYPEPSPRSDATCPYESQHPSCLSIDTLRWQNCIVKELCDNGRVGNQTVCSYII